MTTTTNFNESIDINNNTMNQLSGKTNNLKQDNNLA